MKRKRTEITIETEEVLVVRRSSIHRGWCRECGMEVDMIPMSDARNLAGEGREEGWHHHGERGRELVCLKSLLKSL